MARQEQSPAKGPNRKQQATRKRDEKAQRIIIWIAIGVGVLVLLVLGFGIVNELIIKANAPVARVDDTTIKTKDYQARVRFERLSTQSQILQYENYLTQFDTTDETMQSFVEQLQQQKAQLESQLLPGVATVFGGGVLEKMAEEYLVTQEASRLEVSVTQDEVDRQLEQLFGYDREAVVETTETVTDTVQPMTEEEFNTAFEQFKSTFLRQSGLSEEAFRRTLEVELLRPKVIEVAFPDIETTANQAQVTLLVTDTLEVATGWQQRLNEGESIDTLLEEINSAGSAVGWAADLGWLLPGRLAAGYGDAVEAAAFEIPPGTASEPIATDDGMVYVVFVRGREVRELDAATLSSIREQRFSTWLTEQKDTRVEYLDYAKVTPDTP
ncbi:MAG: hypothetical protein JW892_09770 [Anaerolineae bacterium]|nr:hypothetical protein [Anaerolineae bacterium]